MVTRTLRGLVPLVAAGTLGIATVSLAAFLVGTWRHSQDTNWCLKATLSTVLIPGTNEPVPTETVQKQRLGCAALRRTQRGMFGAVWKTGGQAMAACGVDWAHFQQLARYNPVNAAATVLKPYGIKDALDPGSGSDENRFIHTCLSAGPRRAG